MAEYRSLVESFPPRPIRDEKQLSQTWSRIEELLTKPRRSSAEDDYLSLLSDMVEQGGRTRPNAQATWRRTS